jgi:hypothetical protein
MKNLRKQGIVKWKSDPSKIKEKKIFACLVSESDVAELPHCWQLTAEIINKYNYLCKLLLKTDSKSQNM